MALLVRRKTAGKQTKLFFVTDVHGSETAAFRKFVNAVRSTGVDLLVLGGDISGKIVNPILDLGGGRYRATIQFITQDSAGSEQLQEFQKRAGKLGQYSAVVTPDEYDQLSADPAEVDALYHRLAAERLASWVELAEERLAGTGIRCEHDRRQRRLGRRARGRRARRRAMRSWPARTRR